MVNYKHFLNQGLGRLRDKAVRVVSELVLGNGAVNEDEVITLASEREESQIETVKDTTKTPNVTG